MTWRELFARVWFFLRAHLRRQHMCPECGDAMELHWESTGKWWVCPCGEEEKRVMAEVTEARLAKLREPLPLPLGSPIYITASEFYEIANGVMKEIREEEINSSARSSAA